MSGDLERFDPEVCRGRIAYEHLHRYKICSQFVDGKSVLDLACGTGYGTAILADRAANVVGLDIDDESIAKAMAANQLKNVNFVSGDAYRLPFDNGQFDIVVANEMIEHVRDHDLLLREAKRVLNPRGRLLVSTPNKTVYNRYKQPNPFHVSEMEKHEFSELLEDHFDYVKMIGQRMVLLSASYGLRPGSSSPNRHVAETFVGQRTRGLLGVESGQLALRDPEYLIAICSDTPMDDVDLSPSIFVMPGEDLWLEHEKIMAWASQLHEEDEALRADLASARQQEEAWKSRIDAAEQEVGRLSQGLVNATMAADAEAALKASEIERQLVDAQRDRDELKRQIVAAQEKNLEKARTFEKIIAQCGVELAGGGDPDLVAAMFALQRKLIEQEGTIAELGRQNSNLEAMSAERLTSLRSALEQEMRDIKVNLQEALESSQAALERERLRYDRQLSEAQRAMKEESERERLALAERLVNAQQDFDREIARQAEAVEQSNAEARELSVKLSASRADVAELSSDLTRYRSELHQQLRLTATAEDQAREAKKQSELDRLAVERMRADLNSWNRQLGFAKSHAQLVEHRRTASAHVRKSLAKPSDGLKRPWTLLKRAMRKNRLFDRGYIAGQRPDLADIGWRQYATDPELFRIDPHPLFSSQYYLEQNPDVAEQGINPLVHYLAQGWREGRSPNPYFDNDWYLSNNPDVLAAGVNPLVHYVEYGQSEGRAPNPIFDGQSYLRHNPDVASEGMDPFIHWVGFGQHEGRTAPLKLTQQDSAWMVRGLDVASPQNHLLNSDRIEFPVLASAASRPVEADRSLASPHNPSWPPSRYEDFWLPQMLRDLILEQYGEEWLPHFHLLFAVMDDFQDRPDEFSKSPVGRSVMARCAALADPIARLTGSRPDASVIIPVYNNFLDTSLCILSVLETGSSQSFEIIVADDGSTDATQEQISKIGGCVRYVRQPKNLGFLGNCNSAAEEANGRALVFLNNDTIVMPGWLDGLMRPLNDEGIGLVGSKLLNWDGTLQEAGGIFWRDGSAWNFGRNQDPRAPEFNYLKDVDYCSGASIAVPAKIWRKMSGFDPVFTPAYCEDSDLAFRLRDAGYRTIYNPASQVVHHEGRSHGKDTSSGVKAYQIVNNQRLLDRWKNTLEKDHFENAENIFRARDRSFEKPHVLIIDHYVPQWDKDAGSRTIYEFIRVLLNSGSAVTFWPDNLWFDPVYAPKLQELGVELIHGPKFVNGFDKFIDERRELYDMVLLSRPHVAVHYFDAIRRHSHATIVYYGHDVHFRRMMAQRRLAGLATDSPEVSSMKAQEISVCNQSDFVLYPSEDEARLMAELIDKSVQSRAIAAYRFDGEDLAIARASVLARSPVVDPIKMLFVGGFAHPPNVDAITWFVKEVLPIVRDRGRRFKLSIVGSKASAEVESLRQQDVDVLGFVSDEDLARLYRETHVVVAPLRYGAGVKGKVIEAMARGAPVVTTHVGAQGIEESDRLMFIGDTDEEFAHSVIQACDVEVAKAKALASLDFISENYTSEAMSQVFHSILNMRSSSKR